MRYSGINYRSIPTSNEVTFELREVSVENTGAFHNVSEPRQAFFGLSGDSNSVTFKLISGKIIDPEDRICHGYSSKAPFNFKLNVGATNYEYYINDSLICSSGVKTDFEVNKFFINCNGTEIVATPIVKQEEINYDLTFNSIFYSGGCLTGYFINNSNHAVKIFSGEMLSNKNLFDTSNISNVSIAAGGSGNILLSGVSGSAGVSYVCDVLLHTNFGSIKQRFEAKSLLT